MKKIKMKILAAKDNGISVVSQYNKYFKTNRYEVYYNTKTGFELLRGINGNDDPFILDGPLLLDIGIMGSCKNKCTICYQGDEEEKHMELEDFKMILDQTKGHLNQVALGGRGDPNHHPHFKEIIEYCVACNVVPNYTTSGIELTDEQIEISKMCGAVAVSDYDRDFTYDAIKRIQDAGIKTNIHLVFTIASYNKCIQILYGHDPWKGKVNIDKLNAVVFLLFKPVGRGADKYSLQPQPYQISTFSELLFQKKALMKVGMDSCLVNKVNVPKDMEMFLDTCEGARQSAYIGPSLKMTPCSFIHTDSFAMKITEKKPVEYIWNRSSLFISFRRQLLKTSNTCPIGFKED